MLQRVTTNSSTNIIFLPIRKDLLIQNQTVRLEVRFYVQIFGAPAGIRTPNLLIRSQMLYPLSYERLVKLLFRILTTLPNSCKYTYFIYLSLTLKRSGSRHFGLANKFNQICINSIIELANRSSLGSQDLNIKK